MARGRDGVRHRECGAIGAVDLPVTIDFEGAYASDPKSLERNAALLAATGAIGCT
jgi:2-methylisocitrate lyase-like PEP mutase family enzyme